MSYALATITPDIAFTNYSVTGNVKFLQRSANDKIMIEINVSGLPPNTVHGMNIHGSQFVDGNCTTAGAHWNPLNVSHGAPENDATKRHYGDLGNFRSDARGVVQVKIRDQLISFFAGNNSLTTGSFVIHRDEDDMGLGGQNDSLKNGHTGARVACGNIVIANNLVQSTGTVMTSTTTAPSGSLTASSTSSTSTATVTANSLTTLSGASTSSTTSTSTSRNTQYATIPSTYYSYGNVISSNAIGSMSVPAQILAVFASAALLC